MNGPTHKLTAALNDDASTAGAVLRLRGPTQ